MYVSSLLLRAIILGVLMRACGLASPKVVVSGEYFIKIGIVLMVMNFGNIASVGVRGLVRELPSLPIIMSHHIFSSCLIMSHKHKR
jgi:hypothetical protein